VRRRMKNNISKLTFIFSFILVLTSCYGVTREVKSDILEINSASESTESLNEFEDEIENRRSYTDWFLHENVESLASVSSHVVRAEVLGDSWTEYRRLSVPVDITIEKAKREGIVFDDSIIEAMRNAPVRYNVVTIYTLEIKESFKGNLIAGDIIEVMQRGGVYGNIHYSPSDRVNMGEQDDMILFLYLWTDVDIPFIIRNPFQGAHRIISSIPNELVRGMNLEFENAHEHSGFTITVQDLMNIAEANFPMDNPEDDEATPKITREKLALAIQEAEARVQATYTPISWARLQNPLRDARNVYSNSETT